MEEIDPILFKNRSETGRRLTAERLAEARKKSILTMLILWLLLFGFHRFYLGQKFVGLILFFFFWPLVVLVSDIVSFNYVMWLGIGLLIMLIELIFSVQKLNNVNSETRKNILRLANLT